MRLLLDSHVLLWSLDETERLGPSVTALITDRSNDVLVSAATIWELSIKQSIGRLRTDADLVAHAVSSGFDELPVTSRHAVAIRELPHHHKDPFDRMLVAQARTEGLTLVTADRALRAYDVAILPAAG